MNVSCGCLLEGSRLVCLDAGAGLQFSCCVAQLLLSSTPLDETLNVIMPGRRVSCALLWLV